jgi:hypothetical protein
MHGYIHADEPTWSNPEDINLTFVGVCYSLLTTGDRFVSMD